MSTPARITFPGRNGVRSATVLRPATGRRGVVVAGGAGDTRIRPLQEALVAVGFVAASLEPAADDPVEEVPNVEDVASLCGTLFGSSSMTVGLIALGDAAGVATAVSGALPDVVAAVVLVGGEAPTDDVPVPVVNVAADASPAEVIKALRLSPEP